MAKRISLLLVAALILVFAVAVVGCGGDDNKSSGDSSSKSGDSKSGDSGSKDSNSGGQTPANLDEAVNQCLKEADKASNEDTKKAAKKLCNAAKSQDPEKIRRSAREACLQLAKQIPAGKQRDQAEKACTQGPN